MALINISIQVKAWHMNQCWPRPRSRTPYGVTRPQWVNSLRPSDAYICVSNLTIIGSDNGLSPGRRQAIIWSNAGILLNGPLGTNFSEILIKTQIFSFIKMHPKIPSAKWRPFCPGGDELTQYACLVNFAFSDGGSSHDSAVDNNYWDNILSLLPW